MDRKERLESWLKEQVRMCEGEEMFMGIPDKWYDPHHFCCENGHVSTRYLKSEALGANVCLVCMSPIYICPDITEEELEKILNTEQ